MAEPTYTLFGSITKDDVKVGYISTDRGYIQGVGICEANRHAKNNPGEVFIYKPTRDRVEFLNINEVNRLGENPGQANKVESCPDGLKMDAKPSGVKAVFMGGGGVGVVGNPVISESGQVMAVHLVNGGFGFQYPPLVKIHDDSGIGAGAVVSVGVGTIAETWQYYTDKEAFEDYQLCENPYGKDPYGKRWGPDGKELGSWRPGDFTSDDKPPFQDVLDEYLKKLNESGTDWWTTRKKPPLQITSDGKTTTEYHKVEHWAWGPGTKTPLSLVPFEIFWSSPHRTKGLGFEFVARDGSHSFRIVDTSGKHDGRRKDVYQVKENVTYDVKAIGKRPGQDFKSKGSDKIIHLAEMGLLTRLGAGRQQKAHQDLDANTTGTGDKIFADFLDTLDDNDDLQIQAQRGKFTASNERKVQGLQGERTTYDLTYRLETGREEKSSSFMNKYAISPKPPSNVKGSDFAGRWFTFEWDVDFPYDGEYVFRGGRDNVARLYLDNNPIDLYGGPGSHFNKINPTPLKKTITKGSKKLKLELFNQPIMGKLLTQQPLPPSTDDITFKITSGSMFSNSVRIEGLDINEIKPFTPPEMGKKGQLNVTHTRKIEYGKKYKVVFNSKGKGGGGQGDIKFVGLHSANETIRVVRNRTRLELKDGHGNDTNFALTIDSGKAKFSSDGRKILGSGDVKLTSSWNDKPTAGVAIENIQISGKVWRRSGRSGSQTHTITLDDGSAKPNIKLRTKGSNVIQMEDFTDNDWTDIIVVASGGQFTDLKGNVAYFSVPYPPKKTGQSIESAGQTTSQVFNTIDYINKANRKLWRTNVYSRGGFLNDYGVCPFDTNIQLKDNPYAGTHKIVWSNVNFPISGNYDIEVAVDDNVELRIGDNVKISKKGFVDGTSVSTGTLKLARYITAGTHTITADLYQKPGGSYSFRKNDKMVQKTNVQFRVTSESAYANKITIPGLFSIGKEYKGGQLNQTVSKQVDAEKEYEVILSSAQTKDVKIRVKDNGKRLEMEEWRDGDWQDIVCTVNNGEFYGVQGNRCKFRVDRTIKGINPMALAINIQSTYTEKPAEVPESWNINPMGVALTIDSPPPPIPQEPVPQAKGRCPNNPYWTTRFPGAAERWYPVRYAGWGDLLNQHGISPVPPYDKNRNPVADVSFEIHWHSPHRSKGLGYRFTAQDGSHVFTILDLNKTTNDGSRTETHKVKVNTTYNVKAIGKRANFQGEKIGKTSLGKHDNSKVIELAEQGLLKQLGAGRLQKDHKELDSNTTGTGDKIFADFLDTLDDNDDLQIQAGAGQFTASNPRTVDSLRGTRTTYDLTYRISEVPPNDAGSFTNSWKKSFDFGGYFKAQMEVDDIGELWIDDKKVLDLSRRKNKTFDEKLIWIDGPTSDEEFRKTGPVNHDIKVVVENYKSEKKKKIDAKVFNTLDWIGGGVTKAENKLITFKITSSSDFANGIKISELGIEASKKYKGSQINKTFVRDVEVNKVYDVEFNSSKKARQKDEAIKYEGLHAANNPIMLTNNKRTILLKDGHGNDANATFTIDSGNVKFSDDGKRLIVKGRNKVKFTLSWNDNPNTAGVAINSIKIGSKTWRRSGRSGSVTHTVSLKASSSAADVSNIGNIILKNRGESVVLMEDHTDTSWDDVICSATEGRFFDFNGNKCKFVVGAATKAGGAIAGGTTRDGVTYQGPHLFHYTDSRWGKVINNIGVSPIGSPTQNLSDANDNIIGKKVLIWKDVNFPQTAKYDIFFVADNGAHLFIDGKNVLASKTYELNEYITSPVQVGKGKHDIRIELDNAPPGGNVFLNNPTGVAIKITTKMTVGTGSYKSWKENPLGVSAKLIPPPCPKPVKGKGTVKDPIVLDGGNRYTPAPGPGYPVLLKMKAPIIKDNGINYNCAEDTISLEPSNGVKLSLCKCGPFGRVEKVCIEGDGYFTEPPEIIIDSSTGVNLDIALQFEVVVAPPDIPDIIQVTDLVGLKQTGYYKGKPYYGAVFFENGIKYSGWYKTAGEMVQVYDTMQESIDAMVTTPPSAILRQGSDISSNDPRLNIPNTPDNLT